VFAKSLIGGKLQNMLAFTQRQRQRDAEVEANLTLMRRMLHRLASADTLDVVRGYEGAASAAYYRTLRRFLKADLGFRTRTHHPPTDPVNVLLSLGYTLLYNRTFAAINVVGLDPYPGFFHQTRHGHATLASDLMEEWRTILVDSVVLGMINRAELSAADFQTRDGRVRFKSAGMTRFLQAYDARVRSEVRHPQVQQRLPYLRCIELQVRYAAQVLTRQQPRYLPFRTR
jgi:CRISP-associated protein Cas1